MVTIFMGTSVLFLVLCVICNFPRYSLSSTLAQVIPAPLITFLTIMVLPSPCVLDRGVIITELEKEIFWPEGDDKCAFPFCKTATQLSRARPFPNSLPVLASLMVKACEEIKCRVCLSAGRPFWRIPIPTFISRVVTPSGRAKGFTKVCFKISLPPVSCFSVRVMRGRKRSRALLTSVLLLSEE